MTKKELEQRIEELEAIIQSQEEELEELNDPNWTRVHFASLDRMNDEISRHKDIEEQNKELLKTNNELIQSIAREKGTVADKLAEAIVSLTEELSNR